MAEKFWTHLKLKNGDQVKFVPPAPNGEQLGGITQEEREQISNLTGQVEDLQKLVINEYQTNDNDAYVKPTPMVVADIQKIEGKTIVWRQLSDKLSYTGYGAPNVFPAGVSFSMTHQYLFVVKGIATMFCKVDGTTNRLFSSSFTDTVAFATPRYDIVCDGTNVWVNGTSDGTMSSVQIVDMTELFGVNNLTDVNDDRALWVLSYLNKHPGFNAGELISAPVTGVTVRGVNLWDEQTRTGYYNDSGVWTAATDVWSSANPIYVKSGSTIGIAKPAQIYISEWTRDGEFVKRTNTGNGNTLTLDNRTAYIHFNLPRSMVYENNISINADANDKTYHKYISPVTHAIPASVISTLPGYGWSAGNVSNSIEQDANGNWEYVQRVDRFQLWGVTYGNNGVSNNVQKWVKEIPNRALTSNCLSIFNPSTENKAGNVVYRTFDNKVEFMVSATEYDTSDKFAASLEGQYLYYELVNPIHTSIDLSDFSPFITEPGGTITFENEHKMPVKSTVVHSTDVMSTIQTKLDIMSTIQAKLGAKANTTALNNLAQEVQQNTQNIEDLQELYNDIANEYQIDDSDAYVKITPGHKAEIKSIGGKSIPGWNQLATQEMQFLPNNQSTAKTNYFAFKKGTKFINGHKYLWMSKLKNDGVPKATIQLNIRVNGTTDYDAFRYQDHPDGIYNCPVDVQSDGTANVNDGDNVRLYNWVPANSENYMKDLMIIDLTMLYGAGKEPATQAEFRRDYPNDYYENSLPTVMSAPVTSVTVTGKNLVDVTKFQLYGLSAMTGLAEYSNQSRRKSGFILVKPNTTYYAFSDNQSGCNVWFLKYDQNKQPILTNGVSASAPAAITGITGANDTSIHTYQFTTTQATKYLRVYTTSTAFTHICLSETNEDVEYIEATYEIPESVRSQLNAYGCSIGDVRNTIERNALGQWEYVQRVGRIVFDGDTVKVTEADSNYSDTTTPYNYAYMGKSLFNSRYSEPMNGGKAISTIGEQKTSTTVKQSGGIVMSAVLSLGIKNVAVSGNTKAEYLQAFNDALKANPVDIVYEIATPVRTPIDLPNFGSFQTEPGGTMTFNNQFMMSVPSAVEHSGRNTIIQSPSGGDISFDGDITELVRAQVARLLQEGYIVKHETETRQVFGKNISAATNEQFDIDTHEWSSVVILASYAGTGSAMTMTFSVGSTSYITAEGETATGVPYSSYPMGDGDGDNYAFTCSKDRNLTITSAQVPFLDSMDKIKVRLNFSGDQFNNDWANVTVVLKR